MSATDNQQSFAFHEDRDHAPQSDTALLAKPTDKPSNDAAARRVKIMTIIQSTLSSLLSLAIAVWQGKVYFTFQHTKNVAGAWPSTPDLVPTLLLFSVAVAAFVFDICMLLAYLMPGKKLAKWAIMVGGAAHYVVTSAKTVSYAISAVISKTSFDFGNTTNQNADLWSWTCTDQAATMDSLTQAESNCTTQVCLAQFPFQTCRDMALKLTHRVKDDIVGLRACPDRHRSPRVDHQCHSVVPAEKGGRHEPSNPKREI